MVVEFKKQESEPEIKWEIFVTSSIEKGRCDIRRDVIRGQCVYFVQLALRSIDLLSYLTPEIRSEIYKYHKTHNIE